MYRAVVRLGARPRRRGRRAAGAQRQHGEVQGRRRDAPHRRGAGRAFRVRQSAGHRERGSGRVVPRRGAHAHAPRRAPRPRGYLRPSVGPRRGPDAGRRQGHDAVHGRRAQRPSRGPPMPRRRQRIGRATLRRRTQLSHSRAAPRVRGGQRGERTCLATGAR